jgi:hypothetical protein
MVEYDKKYAEYETPPKNMPINKRNSKNSKICHLKPGITAVLPRV